MNWLVSDCCRAARRRSQSEIWLLSWVTVLFWPAIELVIEPVTGSDACLATAASRWATPVPLTGAISAWAPAGSAAYAALKVSALKVSVPSWVLWMPNFAAETPPTALVTACSTAEVRFLTVVSVASAPCPVRVLPSEDSVPCAVCEVMSASTALAASTSAGDGRGDALAVVADADRRGHAGLRDGEGQPRARRR